MASVRDPLRTSSVRPERRWVNPQAYLGVILKEVGQTVVTLEPKRQT